MKPATRGQSIDNLQPEALVIDLPSGAHVGIFYTSAAFAEVKHSPNRLSFLGSPTAVDARSPRLPVGIFYTFGLPTPRLSGINHQPGGCT